MTHQNHSGSLRQGLVVFIILAFLTFIEFFIAITNQSLLLLGTVAAIKAGLVLYYYMHIYKLIEMDESVDQHSYAWKLTTNRMGFWLFILSDAFLFAGLFVTRFNLLGLTRPDLNQYLGFLVTAGLLTSSFFMNRAETQMGQGNRRGFIISTAITMILGIGFLAGVVGVEWREAPLSVGGRAGGALFFMMTGVRSFRFLTRGIFLGIILNNGRRGLYSVDNHWAVEAATVYWHFIDVVWIFFYPALYLIGRLS